MKRFLLFTIFLISGSTFCQSQSPDVAWKNVDWPDDLPVGPLITVDVGAVPGSEQTQIESGEDWWYDIVNIEEAGVHTGYMVCGFGTFNGILLEELDNLDGCVNYGGASPNCLRPVVLSEHLGSKLMMVAKYDLNGNLIWCKSYGFGDEGAIALTPVSGGNFIFVGWGKSTRTLAGDPIPYNPDGGADFDIPSEGLCASYTSKMQVGKIDGNGNLLWFNQYGYYDMIPSDPFNEDAAGATAIAYDAIETTSGKYRVVGRSQDLNDPGPNDFPPADPINDHYSKFFVVDINTDGTVFSKKLIGRDGYFADAREIKLLSDGTYLITGLEKEGGFEAHGVPPLFLAPNSADAILFKIDEGMNVIDITGGDAWMNGSTSQLARIRFAVNNLNSVGWDVVELNDGKIAWAFFEDCDGCGTSSYEVEKNNPTAHIFLYDGSPLVNIINLADINSYGFSEQEAFDIKIGLIKTQDGGFACVTTYQVSEPNAATAPFAGILSNLSTQVGVTCGADVIVRANTNAYVAKFDSDGNFLWDKSFDGDNALIANYPNDWKEQECVFRITEADDGSLVFVGNTSHNKDDFYIAKINSDCQLLKSLNEEYDLDYSDDAMFVGTTQTWTNGTFISGPFIIPYTFGAINTFDGKLIIPNGVTLTIDGITMEFTDSRKLPYESKVIVEPGGQLRLINGAKLTAFSDCPNSMWDGVEIWGDSSLTQTPENQGKLFMDDLSIIENAIIGAACVKRENFNKDLTKTGGILDIRNSIFRNNLIAIEMRPFQNKNTAGDLIDNVSIIRTTDFIIDAPLNDIEIAYVPEYGESQLRAHQEFILLDGIRGVKILGNDMLIDPAHASLIEDKDLLGYGILSWDSQFKANHFTTSPSDPSPVQGTFENLWIGIYCKPMGEVNDVRINDNVFTNNHIGVAFDGLVNYATITNNEFNIDEKIGFPFSQGHVGLYTKVASGLAVEGNKFNGITQTGSGNNAGIYVKDGSVVASSEIYNNEFNMLDVGIQSSRNNSAMLVDCNDFNQNGIVAVDQIAWHNVPGALMANQGSCAVGIAEAPQANRFFGSFVFDNYQILNQGVEFAYQSYSDATTNITNYDNVNLDPPCLIPLSSYAAACPDHNAPPDFPSALMAIDDLAQEIAGLTGLIDCGSAQVLVDLINSASQPAVIRDGLLACSPYLSDEVISALVNKPGIAPWVVETVLTANAPLTENALLALFTSSNNFPPYLYRNLVVSSSYVTESVIVGALHKSPAIAPWAIKDMLLANSPLTDETLIEMLNRTPALSPSVIRDVLSINTPLTNNVNNEFVANGYPNWVYTQVYSSPIIADDPATKILAVSPRVELENEIEFKQGLKTRMVDNLVRWYLDENNFIDAATLLEERHSTQGSCAILPLLLETRDGTLFYEQLEILHDMAESGLDSLAALELHSFCDFYELMFEIRTQPGGIDSISSTQISSIQEVLSYERAATLNYHNVLEYIGLEEASDLTMHDINFGSLVKASEPDKEQAEINFSEELSFELYPNPASEQINVRYKLDAFSEKAQIIIFDLRGTLVASLQLTHHEGTAIMNCTSMQSGIYLVRIISESGLSLTEKFIRQ